MAESEAQVYSNQAHVGGLVHPTHPLEVSGHKLPTRSQQSRTQVDKRILQKAGTRFVLQVCLTPEACLLVSLPRPTEPFMLKAAIFQTAH